MYILCRSLPCVTFSAATVSAYSSITMLVSVALFLKLCEPLRSFNFISTTFSCLHVSSHKLNSYFCTMSSILILFIVKSSGFISYSVGKALLVPALY